MNVGFNFAQISNADSLITNTGNLERWRWYRNLSFKSNIEEASATYIFYPVLFLHRKTVELLRFNPIYKWAGRFTF